MKLSRYLLPLAALAMLSGPVFAQTATPAAPMPAKPAVAAPAPAAAGKAAAMTPADKAAKSKACSAQADQKGLHGKARKKFRDDCKRS